MILRPFIEFWKIFVSRCFYYKFNTGSVVTSSFFFEFRQKSAKSCSQFLKFFALFPNYRCFCAYFGLLKLGVGSEVLLIALNSFLFLCLYFSNLKPILNFRIFCFKLLLGKFSFLN